MLNYLATATNPLVPVSALVKHCHRQPGFERLDTRALLDFLRNHALVKVIEPMGGVVGALQGMVQAGELAAAEPRIVLATRIPPRQELSKLMLQQVSVVIQALQDALEEPARNPDTVRQLGELLERARELQTKLEKLR